MFIWVLHFIFACEICGTSVDSFPFSCIMHDGFFLHVWAVLQRLDFILLPGCYFRRLSILQHIGNPFTCWGCGMPYIACPLVRIF